MSTAGRRLRVAAVVVLGLAGLAGVLAGGALAGWAIFTANPDALRDVDPGMRGVVCAMGLAFLLPGLGALYWARGIARCLAAARSAGVRHDHP